MSYRSLFKSRRQHGLTLVELMVSLVLGLVLMAGVLQLFAANKSSYQLTDAISAMQENARFALSRMERDIRMAGFLGCTGRDQSSIVINPAFTPPSGFSAAEFTPGNGIEGWEAASTAYGTFALISSTAALVDAATSGWSTSGSPTPDLQGSVNSVSNSDVFRVWHVGGDSALVDVTSPGGTLVGGAPPDYAANDMLMLTDCSSVDVVRACSVSGNNTTLSGCNTLPLLNDTGTAHAFRLIGRTYFIGKRAAVTGQPAPPPALFSREIGANGAAGTAQELVEGVESLQLLFGEDTSTDPDGVADYYVDASQVVDWNNVVSVRVQMLMQSDRDDLVDGSQTFAFNGATVTATDGRLRYPFVATVSLRNRSR